MRKYQDFVEKVAANGRKPSRIFFYAASVLSFVVFSIFLLFLGNMWDNVVLGEDGVLENLSALLFFLSFVVGILAACKSENITIRRWQVVVPVAGFLGFLDEISFGERIFGLKMPVVYGVKIDAVHDFFYLAFKILNDHFSAAFLIPLLVLAGLVATGITWHLRLKILKIIREQEDARLFVWACVMVFAALFIDLDLWENNFAFLLEEIFELNAGWALSCAAFFQLEGGTKSTLVEEWSIGIHRMILDKERFKFVDHTTTKNPVLTSKTIQDQRSGFVADPFLIQENGTFYMFFEVFKKDKASIGLAVSKNCRKWKYEKIVLEEPFHLSYPFVFKWRERYFIIPESHQANSVRLYEAVNFPGAWKFVRTLLSGRDFVDATLLDFREKLWLFVSDTTDGNLYLYYAESFEGSWQEHPQSPIIKNNRGSARPAGNVIQVNERLIRIAQDCLKTYGHSVRAFEITKLTPLEYSEKELPESPLLTASGKGWNKDGMHHLSVCPIKENEWIAAVDGKVINTKIASMHS